MWITFIQAVCIPSIMKPDRSQVSVRSSLQGEFIESLFTTSCVIYLAGINSSPPANPGVCLEHLDTSPSAVPGQAINLHPDSHEFVGFHCGSGSQSVSFSISLPSPSPSPSPSLSLSLSLTLTLTFETCRYPLIYTAITYHFPPPHSLFSSLLFSSSTVKNRKLSNP